MINVNSIYNYSTIKSDNFLTICTICAVLISKTLKNILYPNSIAHLQQLLVTQSKKKRAYNNYLPVKTFNPFKSVLWSYVSISEKEQKIND